VNAFKGVPVDDEACEDGTGAPKPGKSAKEKLDAAIAKAAPVCTPTQLMLAAGEEATLFASKSNPLSLDAQAGNVYCDGTTPIDPAGAGGDDAGTIDTLAADKDDRLKCANTVGSELGKLVAASIKCHIKMPDSFFAGKEFDENVCEENDPAKGKAALQTYSAAMDKLDGKDICTQPCLSRANRDALGTSVLAQVEAANQRIYPCAATTTRTTTTASTSTTSPNTSTTTVTTCTADGSGGCVGSCGFAGTCGRQPAPCVCPGDPPPTYGAACGCYTTTTSCRCSGSCCSTSSSTSTTTTTATSTTSSTTP